MKQRTLVTVHLPKHFYTLPMKFCILMWEAWVPL